MRARFVFLLALAGASVPGAFGQPKTTSSPATSPNRVSPSLASPTPSVTMNGANTGKPLALLTGLVTVDDGSPPPESATIEISCKGPSRPYAKTDLVGSFRIDLNAPDSGALVDASAQAPVGFSPDTSLGSSAVRGGGNNAPDLFGCEMRARLPGFSSSTVSLSSRRGAENPDVGTILLHRLAGVSGFTFSMTTQNAPPKATSAYNKGMELARDKKWPGAEKEFRRAVEIYPKYAIAWESLGRVLMLQKRLDESRAAFLKSVEADGRFVTPQVQLMLISGVQQKWDDVVRYADGVIRLDPYSYPLVYYADAKINQIQGRRETAEQLARKGVGVDEQRLSIPQLRLLLGNLLAERGAYSEALPYLRTYLGTLEQNEESAQLKTRIARMEAAAARERPAAAVPQPQQ